MDTAALMHRMSSAGCKARPELVLAAHAPRVNSTTYAPDDIVISSRKMDREIRKIRLANPNVAYANQEYYKPAEWWEGEYYTSKKAYYERKYGANSTCNKGVFCHRCHNTRCGWRTSEIAKFKNNECPQCQLLPPIGPFDPKPGMPPPHQRSRQTPRIKLVTLKEIATQNLTCWG